VVGECQVPVAMVGCVELPPAVSPTTWVTVVVVIFGFMFGLLSLSKESKVISSSVLCASLSSLVVLCSVLIFFYLNAMYNMILKKKITTMSLNVGTARTGPATVYISFSKKYIFPVLRGIGNTLLGHQTQSIRVIERKASYP
jgi:hypothetical protein